MGADGVVRDWLRPILAECFVICHEIFSVAWTSLALDANANLEAAACHQVARFKNVKRSQSNMHCYLPQYPKGAYAPMWLA